jgi:hypothetical protein
VSGATIVDELHELLKQQLAFPDFYGMSWDAFWDSITGLVDIPDQLTFTGWDGLQSGLPREGVLLRSCLDDYQAKKRTGFRATYAS